MKRRPNEWIMSKTLVFVEKQKRQWMWMEQKRSDTNRHIGIPAEVCDSSQPAVTHEILFRCFRGLSVFFSLVSVARLVYRRRCLCGRNEQVFAVNLFPKWKQATFTSKPEKKKKTTNQRTISRDCVLDDQCCCASVAIVGGYEWGSVRL